MLSWMCLKEVSISLASMMLCHKLRWQFLKTLKKVKALCYTRMNILIKMKQKTKRISVEASHKSKPVLNRLKT